MILRSCLVWLLVAACDCGDNSTAPDAGEAGVDMADVSVDAPPDVGPVGCPEPEAYEVGAAPNAVDFSGLSAGLVGAEALPPDRFGLAAYGPGDFALTNGRAAMLITEANDPGQTYDPFGGRIAGFARVQDDGLVDPADFGIVLLSFGRFLVDTQSVSVISDGSDGPAVIRVAGPFTPLTALGSTVTILDSSDLEGSQAALDFSLAPDSDAIEVTLRVRPTNPERVSLGGLQVFFQANRTTPWRPSAGFAEASGELEYVAYSEDGTTGYAWLPPEGGTLSQVLSVSGADLFSTGGVEVECGENEFVLGRLVMTDGLGLPALQRAATEMAAPLDFAGRVVGTSGTPQPGARVHLVAEDGEHITRFVTGDDGSFDEQVDPRASQAFVWRDGVGLEGPFGLDGDLTVSDTATLRIEANDGDGNATPAKVEVFPTVGDPPSADEDFGESSPGAGRTALEFLVEAGEITLAPGTYRVRVGRGPQYTRFEEVLTLDADTTITPSITEVFPSPGVFCGDFHIHSHRSVDSPDRGGYKLRAIVAEGVAIATRTEHEFVADYAPLIEELGLGEFVTGFGGIELTTVEYGHFIGVPLVPDPDQRGGGAPLWPGMLPTELFDSIRNQPGSPVLIINHPRTGGALQGYFNAAGFDPALGTVERPDLWDERFQVVEVFNDSNFESNVDETVADWFGLLRQGRTIAAVGSSDSHRAASAPLGYPRTCLELGVGTLAEVTAAAVRDSLREGRSTIYGGLDLRVTGPEGEGPGSRIVTASDSASLNVTLVAADYVDSQRIEVYVDGELVETLDASATGEGVRFDGRVDVPIADAGSWVVVHAAGDVPYDANGSLPFGVSNPIYFVRE
ncbi:MAG: CehA/McbA family metallohydrolase [Myxococcota bacterium]